MTIIHLYNPYFDNTYKVIENKADIEYMLHNIMNGDEKFLHLHDYKTGDSITISPACCACVEFKTENEDKE